MGQRKQTIRKEVQSFFYYLAFGLLVIGGTVFLGYLHYRYHLAHPPPWVYKQ
jgi:hypothetical protein